MTLLPIRRGLPYRRYSQPAPLSHRPQEALVHDVHAVLDETLIEWHLSAVDFSPSSSYGVSTREQMASAQDAHDLFDDTIVDWYLAGVNGGFATSSAYDGPTRGQTSDPIDGNPRAIGSQESTGSPASRRSRARAHSLFERPVEAVPSISPHRSPPRSLLADTRDRSEPISFSPTCQTPPSFLAVQTPQSQQGIAPPLSNPVTPITTAATPASVPPLQTRSSPDSPLQQAGEPSRRRPAPDSESKRIGRVHKRLKRHETAFNSIAPFHRARFWDTAGPISVETPLWGSVIQVISEGQVSAHRPLLFLTARPLDIVPQRGDNVVLDLSSKLCIDSHQPGIQTRLTNAGLFDPLDNHQLALATRWISRTLAIHLTKAVPVDLKPESWLLLPLKLVESPTDADASFTKPEISWDETWLIQHGLTWSTPPIFDSGSCLSAFRDMIVRDEDRPHRLMLIDRCHSPPDRHTGGAGAPTDSAATASGSVLRFCISQGVKPRDVVQPSEDRQPLTANELQAFSENTRLLFLPASLLRPTWIIPAFCSALDDALLGHEFSENLFDGVIPFDLSTPAITCAFAAPGYPANNYERYEFLGDTVLRLLCDLDLWCGRAVHSGDATYRTSHLFELETSQSNDHLLQLAMSRGVIPYIRSQPLWRRRWRADLNSNDLLPLKNDQDFKMDPKVGADVVEAFIGVGFVHQGGSLVTALKVMDSIGIQLRHHSQIAHIARAAGNLIDLGYPEPTDQTLPESRGDLAVTNVGASANRDASLPSVNPRCWLDLVSAVLGHRFSTLGDAYTLFGSDRRDPWGSHFDRYSIGHQAIYILIVCDLFVRFPSAKPGVLSRIAKSRVTPECLGAFCVLSGLVDTIRGTSGVEAREIAQYKAELLAGRQAVQSRGSTSVKDFWVEFSVPETLTYYVRAIFADLLCDAAYSFESAHAVFLARLRPFFEQYCQGIKD